MKLVKPAPEMQGQYLKFEREWMEREELIVPYSARLNGRSYEDWCEHVKWYETQAPEGFVTAHTFLMIDENDKIIGAINIRHELNDFLLKYGGHIGYGIVPSERGKGYASQMLSMALTFTKDLGITDVLITCNKSNPASAKTIIRNGGVLENEISNEEDEIIQRYWIKL